jgi:hypothetical protein
MINQFEQLKLDQMEHGLARPIAVLAVEPPELTTKLGIQFESSKDDLDKLDAALLRLPNGMQFALVRHHHAPNPGTDLLVNERRADIAGALEAALEALGMNFDAVTWMHPDIK